MWNESWRPGTSRWTLCGCVCATDSGPAQEWKAYDLANERLWVSFPLVTTLRDGGGADSSPRGDHGAVVLAGCDT